jgi:transposase
MIRAEVKDGSESADIHEWDQGGGLRLVTIEGHPACQVARDLDIHESLLRRWQRKRPARQARAPGVKPSATVVATIVVEQEEIRKLKRLNERLRMERDILKNPRGSVFRLWPEKRLALPWLVEGSGRKLFGGVRPR